MKFNQLVFDVEDSQSMNNLSELTANEQLNCIHKLSLTVNLLLAVPIS